MDDSKIQDLDYLWCEKCNLGFVRVARKQSLPCPYCSGPCLKCSDADDLELQILVEHRNRE